MTVRLVVKTGFHAFGKDYPTGMLLDPVKDTEGWPTDAMANRLRNDWLEYRDVPDEAPVDGSDSNYEAIQRASNAGHLPDESRSPDQDASDTQSFSRMSADDLKAFVDANGLAVNLDEQGSIGAKRRAVRDAYASRQAGQPLGGVAT